MYNPWDVDETERSDKKRPNPQVHLSLPPRRAVFLGCIAALLLWLVSGFYQVDLGSVAVVTRFGKMLETQGPGWHYRLPPPIDEIYKCNTSVVQQMRASRSSSTITGDRNLVDVSYTVQWRIQDPIKWFFRIYKADNLISLTADSCMRDAVNSINIDDALAEGRHKIELMVKDNLQQMLDSYDSGIFVQEVTLRSLDPPREVADSFYDVEKALADHHHSVNQAEAFRNEALPKARAHAAQILEEARAKAYRDINMADEEMIAFGRIYETYRGEGRLGVERYLQYQALQKAIEGQKMSVVDGNPSVLPFLPLKRSSASEKKS